MEKKRSLVAVGAAALVAVGLTLVAQPVAAVSLTSIPLVAADTSGGSAVANAPVFLSGQRVAVDPHTKKLRPLTPEEEAALSQGTATQPVPGEVAVIRHPEGYTSVVLDEQYMSTALAKLNPDGTLAEECVDSPAEAAAFFASGSVTAHHDHAPAVATALQTPVLEER